MSSLGRRCVHRGRPKRARPGRPRVDVDEPEHGTEVFHSPTNPRTTHVACLRLSTGRGMTEPDRPKWTTGREHRLTPPDDSLPDGSLPGDISSRCSRPNRNRSAHHGRSDPAAEQIRADYFSVRKKCAAARRGSDDPRSTRQPSDFTASEAENIRPGSRPSKYPPSDSARPAALHSAPGASNRCSTTGAAMSATIGPYTMKT